MAAAIGVTSSGSKNQHAGKLPNSNKKLKNVSVSELRRNTLISYRFLTLFDIFFSGILFTCFTKNIDYFQTRNQQIM